VSYYGQGDYYGQGGLGSILKTVAKGAIGFATGGPAGAFAAVAPSVLTGGGGARSLPAPVLPAPGLGGLVARAIPGGKTGLIVETGRRRYRRMNYTNVRALRRADRRIDGFVREARKALKHTNYALVSKSARKSGRSKPSVIVETGPGGVRA
jgi:hypothetical protein